MVAETASIEVEREIDRVVDLLRSYELVVDGAVVDRLAPGMRCAYEVAAGTHEIFLKLDWCRSEKIEVHLSGGQTARFRCGPRANVLTDLYWATLGRRRYIRLTRVTD